MFHAKLLNKKLDNKQGKFIIKYTFTSAGKRRSGYVIKVENMPTTRESLSFAISPWHQDREQVKIFSSTQEAYDYLSEVITWVPKILGNTAPVLIQKFPEKLWVLSKYPKCVNSFGEQFGYVQSVRRHHASLGTLKSAKLYPSEAQAMKTGKRFGCKAIPITYEEYQNYKLEV